MQGLKLYMLCVLGFLFITACQPGAQEKKGSTQEENKKLFETTEGGSSNDEQQAVANLSSASGSEVSGKATFTNAGENKVRLELTVENVPEGLHAVHLHEKGDCSASDASSAGGHWNPTDQPHGKRGSEAFHAGDIGNLEIGGDGKASMSLVIEGWCIGGGAACDILDKAVIVHAGKDDFTSQPSGAAGKRIACGVIERTDRP